MGTRAIKKQPTSKRPNVHQNGTISGIGVIVMDRKRGAFRTEDAQEWFNGLATTLIAQSHRIEDVVVTCDNAPCHKRFRLAVEGMPRKPHLLHLAPYSPMLNPIENVWSKIKSNVRRSMEVPEVMAPGLGEQRLQYLERLIGQVTVADCWLRTI